MDASGFRIPSSISWWRFFREPWVVFSRKSPPAKKLSRGDQVEEEASTRPSIEDSNSSKDYLINKQAFKDRMPLRRQA